MELDLWYLLLHTMTPKYPRWKFTASLQCYFSWGGWRDANRSRDPREQRITGLGYSLGRRAAITLGLIHCPLLHSEWMGLNEWVMLSPTVLPCRGVSILQGEKDGLTRRSEERTSFQRKINPVCHILLEAESISANKEFKCILKIVCLKKEMIETENDRIQSRMFNWGIN